MESREAVGIVLAAGAGTRAGGPKALRRDADGPPWIARAEAALREAGCGRVIVVLGAAADEARALVGADSEVVVAPDWAEGLSASLRAGLAAAEATDASVALVTLVDLPGLPSSAARRVLDAGAGRGSLARAVHAGRPGHPVLLGRDHWAAIASDVSGDRGAGPYLAAHAVLEIECGDLWDGRDLDI